MDALKVQLGLAGVYYASSYPYFYSVSDPEAQNFVTAYTAWPDKNTLGAAFNLNMFLNMPVAYAHNRFYTKWLIYDSIDWVDDNIMNNSVSSVLEEGTPEFEFLINSDTGGRP